MFFWELWDYCGHPGTVPLHPVQRTAQRVMTNADS